MTDPVFTNGIDHPIVAVRDMASARAAYERLGFTITPRGRHPQWGTGNWCIMFPSDYIELRGVIDPAAAAAAAHLTTDREGLMGVALGTEDAHSSHKLLVDRGLNPQPVRNLARHFELPEGVTEPQFALCFLDQADTSGLMSVVLCQHLTPELLRKPEWLQHANGAVGVLAVTGVLRDRKTAAGKLRKLFGEANVRMQAEGITLSLMRQSLRLLEPAAATAQLAEFDVTLPPRVDALFSITLGVRSLAETRSYFEQSAIQFRTKDNGELLIDPHAACGVLLEFTSCEPAADS